MFGLNAEPAMGLSDITAQLDQPTTNIANCSFVAQTAKPENLIAAMKNGIGTNPQPWALGYGKTAPPTATGQALAMQQTKSGIGASSA